MPKLIDVVSYQDATGTEIVHKIPEGGPGDIKWGAQLVVMESQAAVFFRDGRALDVFGPGRHTLTTANLPLLQSIVKFVSGGQTPFQAEVYFVNQKVFEDMKWGTPQPIDMNDPDYGPLSLRAFGNYSMQITDPQLFINNLVGTQGIYTSEKLNGFLKAFILKHLNTLLAETFTSYFKIRKEFETLSAAMKFKVKDEFAKYGVELRDFNLVDISVPPEVKASFDKVRDAYTERKTMDVLGDMGRFTQYEAAKAMRDMANNPSGAGGPMGMGAGLGMGMMMPQLIQQGLQGQPMQTGGGGAPAPAAVVAGAAAAVENCPSCKEAVPAGAKFCLNCGGKMKPECPSCKAELPSNAKFCVNCGHKME